MTFLMSNTIKFLSQVSIGIGLTYSIINLITKTKLGEILTLEGLILCVLGFACIYAYKKSLKFDFLMVLKICSGVFLSVILSFATIIHICPIQGLMPSLFAASTFFAIGFIGIYGDRKYRKLGFSFMTLSLLFLIGVIIANVYQEVVSRFGSTWISTPYQGYTMPLIIVSIAFFVLGCTLILHKKFQTITKQNLDNTKTLEEKNIKCDSNYNNQTETSLMKKPTINLKSLGFSFIVFSPLIIIWAAILYRPDEVFIGSVPVSIYAVEDALPIGLIGVALFALGFGLMFYKKSMRLGFFLVASGSIVLIIAGFAYRYETEYTELVFGYVPLINRLNPYREFTLPLIIASLVAFVLGYILMGKKEKI